MKEDKKRHYERRARNKAKAQEWLNLEVEVPDTEFGLNGGGVYRGYVEQATGTHVFLRFTADNEAFWFSKKRATPWLIGTVYSFVGTQAGAGVVEAPPSPPQPPPQVAPASDDDDFVVEEFATASELRAATERDEARAVGREPEQPTSYLATLRWAK